MASNKGKQRQGAFSGGVITLRDVANAAGVSAQTVSCVVNNRGSVSDPVRQMVRRIADELGYVPNKSAQFMRTGRSRAIGLVISDIRRPFFPELAHYVQKAALEARYAVLIADTSGSKQEVAERLGDLKGHGVDGVLTTEDIDAVYDLGVPTVMIGHPIKGAEFGDVGRHAGRPDHGRVPSLAGPSAHRHGDQPQAWLHRHSEEVVL